MTATADNATGGLLQSLKNTKRRLKRNLRRRQSVFTYIRKFGPTQGLKVWSSLIFPDRESLSVSIPQSAAPLQVRTGTSDPFIFEEVFIDEEYDFTVPGEPKTIFDIGANVGYTSIYFSHRYPGARIIAVEPDASNIGVLRRNVGANPQIEVVEAGIWHHNARLTLANQGANTSDFQFREAGPDEPGIKAVTVEDLLQLADADWIDILKIDIEGAEKELFAENTGWLGRVGTLVIELHDRFKPGCRDSFMAAVSRYGFKGYAMGLNYIVSRDAARRSP